jgi:hypothetical protein
MIRYTHTLHNQLQCYHAALRKNSNSRPHNLTPGLSNCTRPTFLRSATSKEPNQLPFFIFPKGLDFSDLIFTYAEMCREERCRDSGSPMGSNRDDAKTITQSVSRIASGMVTMKGHQSRRKIPMPPPPHHSRLIQGSSSSNTESVDGAANLFEESALPSSFSARRRRNLLRFGLAANGLDLVPPPPLLQRPRRPPRGGARIALRDSCVLCGYCRGRDWALFGELLLFRLSYRAAEQRSAWSELLAALVGGGVPPANSAAVCAPTSSAGARTGAQPTRTTFRRRSFAGCRQVAPQWRMRFQGSIPAKMKRCGSSALNGHSRAA